MIAQSQNIIDNMTGNITELDNDIALGFFDLEKITCTKELRAYWIEKNLTEIIKKDQLREKSLFLHVREGFLQEIAKRIVENPRKAIAIGISGQSASGKTTFVVNSLKAINEYRCDENICTLINADDYYKDASQELKKAGSFQALFDMGFNFDVPDSVNLKKMKSDIFDLLMGNEIRCPRYNFVTCESLPDGEIKIPAKVTVIEGLFALNHRVKNILDIAIYVEAPHEIIKERWFRRAESRGKTGKAAEVQFNIVNKEAQTHIRPTADTADIIINGLLSGEYIEYIARELFTAIHFALEQEI